MRVVGLFGVVEGATVQNIVFERSLSSDTSIVGDQNVGTVAGEVWYGSQISNITSNLKVSANGESDEAQKTAQVGGIAGLNRGTIRQNSFSGEASIADMNRFAGLNIGGLVGNLTELGGDAGSIINSYSTGRVSVYRSGDLAQSLVVVRAEALLGLCFQRR